MSGDERPKAVDQFTVELTDGTILAKQYVTAGEYWIKLLHASDPTLLYFIWVKCSDPDAELPEALEQQLIERHYLDTEKGISRDFQSLVKCSVRVDRDGEDVTIVLQNPRASAPAASSIERPQIADPGSGGALNFE
jgi:hypothetical protein